VAMRCKIDQVSNRHNVPKDEAGYGSDPLMCCINPEWAYCVWWPSI